MKGFCAFFLVLAGAALLSIGFNRVINALDRHYVRTHNCRLSAHYPDSKILFVGIPVTVHATDDYMCPDGTFVPSVGE